MHGAMHSIQSCCHPVIARISGFVYRQGRLALMCDIRICSTSSKFGVPINKLGLVMKAYPEIAALVRVVGPSTDTRNSI